MQLNKDTLNQEYANPSHYENRISILNYADPTFDLWEWTASHYDLASKPAILEVGCGNGVFWRHAASKLTAENKVVLTDFSEGMLEATRNNLKDIKFPCSLEFKTADVEKLPFADNSFDAVLAHLMLYHAQSQQQALAEISRVLKPNGMLGVSTIDPASTLEIHALAHKVDAKVPAHPVISASFSEKIADQLLPKFFSVVEKYPKKVTLHISEPGAVIHFMRNSCTARKFQLSEDFYREFDPLVKKELEEKGVLTTTYHFILYLCQEVK